MQNGTFPGAVLLLFVLRKRKGIYGFCLSGIEKSSIIKTNSLKILEKIPKGAGNGNCVREKED